MSEVAVGLDIGGTKISACLINQHGQASASIQIATPSQEGAQAILDTAANLILKLINSADQTPITCGIGSAGIFDLSGNVLQATEHLRGWAGTALSDEMTLRLGIPTFAMNDVHAAALGELWFGAPTRDDRLAFVAVGSGISGAIIADRRVLRGNSGQAGAIGHVPVATEKKRICKCGGTNHLEAFASGLAIEQTYYELSGIHLELQKIGELARDKDAKALSAIQIAIDFLAEVLAYFITITDPGLIILGGGVVGLGSLFVNPLFDQMRTLLQVPAVEIEMQVASLGNNAAMVGAGALALRHVNGEVIGNSFS